MFAFGERLCPRTRHNGSGDLGCLGEIVDRRDSRPGIGVELIDFDTWTHPTIRPFSAGPFFTPKKEFPLEYVFY